MALSKSKEAHLNKVALKLQSDLISHASRIRTQVIHDGKMCLVNKAVDAHDVIEHEIYTMSHGVTKTTELREKASQIANRIEQLISIFGEMDKEAIFAHYTAELESA